MAQGQIGSLLRHIRRLIGGGPAADVPDGRLLEQFLQDSDESAFTALVERHGPLVMGVCRRLLHDPHEAEDAFQATFFVLARRAGAIRNPEALSSWLYGVAYRVAARARGESLKRRSQESQVTAMPADSPNASLPDRPSPQAGPLSEASRRELRSVIDQELNRLPEKYRRPMVLCYLEGKSNEEAAQQLRWTKGTVSGRLARARDLLRDRLARRGMVLSSAVLAVALAQSAAPAAVPAGLVASTVKGAVLFTAGKAAGIAVSAKAAALAQGAMHAMTVAKIKVAACVLLAVGLAGSSAAVVTYHALGDSPVGPAAATSTAPDGTSQPALPPDVDPARYDQAPLVLRVKKQGQLRHGPQHDIFWHEVEILHVLKNTTAVVFHHKTTSVSWQGTRDMLPAEPCTVYLEPHHPGQPDAQHWTLLGKSVREGISHVGRPAEKTKAGH